VFYRSDPAKAPGRLVLFPLYTPHATEPSGIEGARICLAFDIVPAVGYEQRWAEAEHDTLLESTSMRARHSNGASVAPMGERVADCLGKARFLGHLSEPRVEPELEVFHQRFCGGPSGGRAHQLAQRLGNLLRFAGVAKRFIADDAQCYFMKIGLQGAIKLRCRAGAIPGQADGASALWLNSLN